MARTPESVVGDIVDLLIASSTRDYIGEGVSQLEHALQCAKLASDAGADDEEVVAALLHDIGHLIAAPDAERMQRLGAVDHESLGARYLIERGFSSRVGALVSSHVEAKRYLVATNARYNRRLSAASRATLALQGGSMSPDEVARFRQDALMADKLRLRQWDDAAKRPGWIVPELDHYRSLLLRHLHRS